MLQTDIGRIPIYCHMTGIDGCGDGGWMLVMKINGNKVKSITGYGFHQSIISVSVFPAKFTLNANLLNM